MEKMCIWKTRFRPTATEQKMLKFLVTTPMTFKMQSRLSMNKLMLHLSADKAEVVEVEEEMIVVTSHVVSVADNEMAVSDQEVIDWEFYKAFSFTNDLLLMNPQVTGETTTIARVAVFLATIKFNPNLIWFLYIHKKTNESWRILEYENISEYLKNLCLKDILKNKFMSRKLFPLYFLPLFDRELSKKKKLFDFISIFKKDVFIQRIKYNNDQLQIQLHKKILQTRNLMMIAT